MTIESLQSVLSIVVKVCILQQNCPPVGLFDSKVCKCSRMPAYCAGSICALSFDVSVHFSLVFLLFETICYIIFFDKPIKGFHERETAERGEGLPAGAVYRK